MKAWSRWQDWVNVLAGVYLFVSSWILGFSTVTYAAWSGWGLGVLVCAVALWALAVPESEAPEWCSAVLGLVSVAVPWVFGLANLNSVVWSFVVSGLVVLAMSAFALYQIRSGSAHLAHK